MNRNVNNNFLVIILGLFLTVFVGIAGTVMGDTNPVNVVRNYLVEDLRKCYLKDKDKFKLVKIKIFQYAYDDGKITDYELKQLKDELKECIK